MANGQTTQLAILPHQHVADTSGLIFTCSLSVSIIVKLIQVVMSTCDSPGHLYGRPVFPQELFDKLIDSVQVDSPRHPTLLNFSFVSKSWTHHSRKWVFHQVELTSKNEFELWCKNTVPGPNGSSALVHFLVFSQLGEDI